MSRRPPKKRRKPVRRQASRPDWTDALAEMAMEAVAWMAIGDNEKTADAVTGIMRRGPVAVHGALLGWARYAHVRMTAGEQAAPGEMWGMKVISEDSGADALGSPSVKGAVAILSYAANSDHDGIDSVIGAAIEGGGAVALGKLMLQTVSFAAAYLASSEGEARDAQ